MAISMDRVPHFNEFSVAAAKEYLLTVTYSCETNGVYLSSCGNNITADEKKEYYKEKSESTLFNVEKVQAAYAAVDKIIQPSRRTFTSSAAIAEALNLPNGDVIAAMILQGHRANFLKRGQLASVNCDFKVDLIPQ